MDGLLVAVISLAAVIALQRIFLFRSGGIKGRQQAFALHALRDDLQLMVANNQVERTSVTYDFLMTMLNFAIKNAGVVKLRDLLVLSNKVRSDVVHRSFENVQGDIKKHSPEVQELSAKFFFVMANMLVSNDWIVNYGVKAAKLIVPPIKIFASIMSKFLRVVMPERVEAVSDVRRYRDWGNRLHSCH